VALRERNSGIKSSRELFKGSKDLASHPVCTYNFFGWVLQFFFVSDVILLGHFGPLALGPNHEIVVFR